MRLPVQRSSMPGLLGGVESSMPGQLHGQTVLFARALPTPGISRGIGASLPGLSPGILCRPLPALPGHCQGSLCPVCPHCPGLAASGQSPAHSFAGVRACMPGSLRGHPLPASARYARSLPQRRLGHRRRWANARAEHCPVAAGAATDADNPPPPLPRVTPGVKGGPPLDPLQKPRARP